MAWYLRRGWVPHDEGAFGEAALRVLGGELPHRDYDELYTGGLTYLHALGFRALGIDLASLRIVLFAWFLAWVPAVYCVASRWASPLVAGSVTLLAVAWSVPNYAAAVPSWYNLFFATFGVLALLRHLEHGSRRALFVAGLAGGVSVLVKSPGLYYVGGVLLFLLYRAQRLAGTDGASGRAAVLTVVLALPVVALLALVRSPFGAAPVVQFVLPIGALVLVIVRDAWRRAGNLAALGRLVVPFVLGAAAPIAAFVVPYALAGALPALVRGLFVLPAKRLSFARVELPALASGWPIVPVLAAAWIAAAGPRRLRTVATVAVAAVLAGVFVSSGTSRTAYGFAWHALDLVVPALVVAGAALVASEAGCDRRRQQAMLLLCVLAPANLVRFPFSAPIYFCYVAPLVVLSAAAVIALLDAPPRGLVAALGGFYLAFAVLRVTPGFIYAMGIHAQPDPETVRLTLPRAGGLRVAPDEATEYERLIPLVQAHGAGEFIYAGPDCPEVYFLAERRNPGRELFDFFDDTDRRTRVLRAIETHDVRVVVLSSRPQFSPRDRELERALAARFPETERVGRFEVRWR